MKKNTTKTELKVGDRIPITIKRIGINGEGVGYYKRKVTFIPGALPGEEVVAQVQYIHPNRIEAKVHKLRKKDAERTTPKCAVYEECGGCQLQHVNYTAQLKLKRDIVIQAFERYSDLSSESLNVLQTIGMKDPWSYRNKSQLQVTNQKQGVIAGLYKPGSHKIVDITGCPIQHQDLNTITKTAVNILEDLNIPIYNERKRKGIVRTIVTRVGIQSGEVQLVLITTQKQLPKEDLFIQEVTKRLPKVHSIVQNVNPNKTSRIFGYETFNLYGKEKINEVLGSFSFELSARAFFQLNPIQTEKLYNIVKQEAALTGKEKVVDAYCGVGTIGLWIAPDVAEVRGMDIIGEAVLDARENAKRNNVSNAKYYKGEAEKLLPKWVREGWKPDVIIVDPPRTGLDIELLKTIINVKPKRFIYVSCNPSTLAKNSKVLIMQGFTIKKIQPVDMFPQTSQVETIVTFEREI